MSLNRGGGDPIIILFHHVDVSAVSLMTLQFLTTSNWDPSYPDALLTILCGESVDQEKRALEVVQHSPYSTPVRVSSEEPHAHDFRSRPLEYRQEKAV